MLFQHENECHVTMKTWI